ncbi:MAG: LCP family protein [Oscillospiraceae bacterium]|nr:LCP family protein [Oscillospiraceae bacterium]
MDKDQREELELESKIEESKEEIKAEKTSKKNKKKFLLIIPAFFVVLGIIAAVFINHKLKLINYGDGLDYTLNTDESFVEDETVDFGEIDDVTGNTYKDILKNWALTTDAPKLKSNHIINILLVGSDASSKDKKRTDIMENGNTDVMMLVSVNTQDKTIKLVSFMRDSYTYLKGYDKFARLNAACANGGPAYLVDVIEDNYKIEIDGYAMVDFDTFTQCIDIVGGVNVNVPEAVGKKYKMPYGENVLLNGEQALNFCRERKLFIDSDISRTRNQRMLVTALINKCKSASLTTINSVIDTILANVHTSFRKKEVVSYMTKALSDGWANYTVTQRTMPTADARYGYSGSAWIWVIDYPLAAQKLQNELYGTTNIKLEENRKTAITVMGGYVTEDKGN